MSLVLHPPAKTGGVTMMKIVVLEIFLLSCMAVDVPGLIMASVMVPAEVQIRLRFT